MKYKVMRAQRAIAYQVKISSALTFLIESQPTDETFLPDLISDLNGTDKEILSMFYTYQFSIPKIAYMLNLSESAVKMRLHRARGRLKKQ